MPGAGGPQVGLGAREGGALRTPDPDGQAERARRETVRNNVFQGLARKPAYCLEYILVHELTHLLERTHNHRFTALMDQFMPQWRDYRKMLNTSTLTHESWGHDGGLTVATDE